MGFGFKVEKIVLLLLLIFSSTLAQENCKKTVTSQQAVSQDEQEMQYWEQKLTKK